jgi:RimJ/RimL family protein N-acetyltransferase
MNINSYARFNFGRYTVRDKKSQKLIGMCGFLTTEMGIDFGYRLSKDTWGYGLGFEAASTVLCYGLEVIGLTDLVAGAMPENLASIKILESLGFIYQADVNLDGLNYRKYAFSLDKK